MFLLRIAFLLSLVVPLGLTSDAQQQATSSKAQAPQGRHTIRDLQPTVLLISLDGFRYDYPEKAATPNLHRLMAGGVRAERIVPVFPTKTFPTHYSMVTGRYVQNHGIVANTMWDPDIRARFSLSARDQVQDARWWGGEPIWVTAVKQGQKAATLFWPGSEAPIQGVRPTYWRAYDAGMTHDERVRQVLSWLDLPVKERPTFICMYFSDTDDTGHAHGPDSPEVARSIAELDRTIGDLLDGLRNRGILDQLNIIVTADHGMAATSPDRLIILDDLIDLEDAEILEVTPLLTLRSRSGKDDALYEELVKARRPMSVYRKIELPERWRVRKNQRTTPIVAVADEGWTITTRSWLRKHPETGRGGTHGYDNSLVSMSGVFVAHGPAFARGKRVGQLRGVDLYALMAHILRLAPARNDGSLLEMAPVLARHAQLRQRSLPARSKPAVRSQTARVASVR